MAQFVLLIFLFGAAGPHQEFAPFETLERCEAARATVAHVVADHNATSGTAKIGLYAAVCVPLEKAGSPS